MHMVGFIVGGVLAVLVLFALRQGLRRRRFYAGFHRSFHGRHHGCSAGRRGLSRRHALLARLQTTPEQEQVLSQAREQLQPVLSRLREEQPLTREQAARSVEAELFDAAALQQRFAQHAALLEELQRTALDALARVHAALEPAQRRELATVLAGSCGPRLAR
jgi:Spy/CpxP family protein refolding chaperone